MNAPSRSQALIALMLFFACVVACKSTSSTTNTSSSQTSSSNSSSPSTDSKTTTAPPNIAGKYNVAGTNPNGSAYKGALEVIPHGDVYQFRWSAGNQSDGVGVVNGDVVA